MSENSVTVFVQMADRTRRARVTLSRHLTINDLIRTSRSKWSLGFAVDYQVYNLANGRQLLAHDFLTEENVHNGDTLMLQPFATHGADGICLQDVK